MSGRAGRRGLDDKGGWVGGGWGWGVFVVCSMNTCGGVQVGVVCNGGGMVCTHKMLPSHFPCTLSLPAYTHNSPPTSPLISYIHYPPPLSFPTTRYRHAHARHKNGPPHCKVNDMWSPRYPPLGISPVISYATQLVTITDGVSGTCAQSKLQAISIGTFLATVAGVVMSGDGVLTYLWCIECLWWVGVERRRC